MSRHFKCCVVRGVNVARGPINKEKNKEEIRTYLLQTLHTISRALIFPAANAKLIPIDITRAIF